MRSMPRWLVPAVGLILLTVSGCIASPSKATPASVDSPTSTPTTRPTPHVTTTTGARLDPVALAHIVSLAPADVPSATQAVTAPKDVTRAVEDACRPLESSPYLAAISSNSFETNSKGYSSVVAVEPSEPVAAMVVTALASLDWRQRCLASKADARLMQIVNPSGQAFPSDCRSDGSEDANIPASDLPAGVTGRKVSSTISCSTSETTVTYWSDVAFARVGAVVIVFAVEGLGAEPGPDDLRIIESMIDRARNARTS